MDKFKPKLNSIDLRLYAAGTMAWYKKILIWIIVTSNKELKEELKTIQVENDQFQKDIFPSLKEKIFTHNPLPEVSVSPSTTETDNSIFLNLSRPGLKLAAGFAAVVIGVCVILPWQLQHRQTKETAYTAKGYAMGVHLLIKGKSIRKADNFSILAQFSDTIQVLPISEDKQYLAMFGWDRDTGLNQIFPSDGQTAGEVSIKKLPPALFPDSSADNKLICVTSPKPFKIRNVRNLLSENKFSPISNSPESFLEKDFYVQIFSITTEGI